MGAPPPPVSWASGAKTSRRAGKFLVSRAMLKRERSWVIESRVLASERREVDVDVDVLVACELPGKGRKVRRARMGMRGEMPFMVACVLVIYRSDSSCSLDLVGFSWRRLSRRRDVGV